jgi:hypothetical protein
MATWRVGRKLGRTLYRDDQCVGMVDTPELASEIVRTMTSPPEQDRHDARMAAQRRVDGVISAARGVEACFSGVGAQLVLAKPGRELEDSIGDLRAALAVYDRKQDTNAG